MVDDHFMGITHVFRGVEWLISTPKHLALYNAFKWKPPSFAHLPLIMNADGTKLSKRQKGGERNPVHLEQFREKGYYPDAIINFITLTGGGFRDRDFSIHKIYSLQELISKFQCTLLKTHSSKIDFENLNILNQNLLRQKLNVEPVLQPSSEVNTGFQRNVDLSVLIEAKAQMNRVKSTKTANVDDDTLLSRLKWLVQEGRIAKLSDLSESKDFLFLWSEPGLCDSYGMGVNGSVIKEIIESLKTIESEKDFYAANLSNKVRRVAKSHKKNGLKVAELMTGIRLALSGLKEGPPVGEMLEQLGLDTSIHRLQKAAESMENQP